jgi:hypothetical protein
MSWISNLFKKEKKEERVIEEPSFIPSPIKQEDWKCNFCEGTIDVGERWSKFQGKYYHKFCFKKMKRGVSSGIC